MVTEIERIDDLIARLRGLTPTVHRLAPLDILGPIRDTLVLLKGQFEQAHVIVSTSFDEGLPLIAADSNQLKQLFLNICVNAVEAMSSGGQLHVRVRAQEALGARTVTAEFEDSGAAFRSGSVQNI